MFSASDDWENGMLGEEENSVEDDIKGTSELFLAQRTAKVWDSEGQKITNSKIMIEILQTLKKSAEEISKFCVAEGLDEISRTISILKNGMPIQKTSILSKFQQQSIGKFRDAFRDKIIPICLEILSSESIQYQIECANNLLAVVPQMNAMKSLAILLSAKLFINHKSEELSKPWREVYIAAISKMSEEDVKKEVLLEAMADVGTTASAQAKIWSGRKLAALAGKLDAKKFESHLYPKVSILCQDTDGEVRKAMCSEMGVIIKSLGLKVSKKTIIPEFLDLINDEDMAVQEAALCTLMDLCDLLDAETRINTLIPTWKKLCASNDEKLVVSGSLFIGPFLWNCKDELADSDRQLFASYYQSLSSSPEVVVRRNCAFNYPAIVTMFKPQNFISFKFDTMLGSFEKDEDLLIRKTFACFFNELCNLLGTNAFRHLGDALKQFLECHDESVQKEIYKNLASILTIFQTANNPKFQSYLDGLLAVIIESRKVYEEKPNTNWRMHEIILKSMECFPTFFDNDQLYDNFVGSLQKILLESFPGPVKKQAAKILVTFMRRLKKHEHHETILRILLDIKDERSYQVRMLYFDICEEVLSQFSQRFFRSYFFIPLVGLSRDLIPNIRMRFVELLPLARRTIRVPTDQILLSKLADVCESLALRDTDSGVLKAMTLFQKKHGMISAPECCQISEVTGTTPPKVSSANDIHRVNSQSSLTDAYLKSGVSLDALPSNEIDKQKEEAEQKSQFFLLDPSKRTNALKITTAKKTPTVASTITAAKKPLPVVKKEVPVSNKQATPISSVTAKISNPKPLGTPSTTSGEANSKVKESTTPRVTKPIAKKDSSDANQPNAANQVSSSSSKPAAASAKTASAYATKPNPTPLAKKLK